MGTTNELWTLKFPKIINISAVEWLLKQQWYMDLINVVIYKINLKEEIRNDGEPICKSIQAIYKYITWNME